MLATEQGMPADLLLVRHGESEGNLALEAAKDRSSDLMGREYRERSASDKA